MGWRSEGLRGMKLRNNPTIEEWKKESKSEGVSTNVTELDRIKTEVDDFKKNLSKNTGVADAEKAVKTKAGKTAKTVG